MLPPLLLHEVFELLGAVTGVLRHGHVDLLGTELAPYVAAPVERAADDVRFLILALVNKQCLLAPAVKPDESEVLLSDVGPGRTYLRQCIIVENLFICISTKTSYCSSVRPSC